MWISFKVPRRGPVCKPRPSASTRLLAHLLIQRFSPTSSECDHLDGLCEGGPWARPVSVFPTNATSTRITYKQDPSETVPVHSASHHVVMSQADTRRDSLCHDMGREDASPSLAWLPLAPGRREVPPGPGNHTFLQDPGRWWEPLLLRGARRGVCSWLVFKVRL